MKLVTRVLAAWVLTLIASTSAHAAPIVVLMTGLSFNYQELTGSLCDSGGGVGCNGAMEDATSLRIFVDGNLEVFQSGGQFGLQLFVPAGTSPATIGSTGIVDRNDDIIDFSNGAGAFLLTDILTGSVSFGNGGNTVGGSGTSELQGGALPSGLIPTNPVAWSFVAQGACEGVSGTQSCSYVGNATFSFEAEAVPEPSAMVLLGAGLAVSALARRRRHHSVRTDAAAR